MSLSRSCIRSLSILVSVLVLSCLGNGQVQLNPSYQVRHALVFLDSPDAPGTLDPSQVRLCFSLLAQRLKLPENQLPHVLVLHVSKEVAHAADVHASSVRRNAASDSRYYEFWIVGTPKPAEYVRYFDTLFEEHFNLKLSQEERQKAAAFVLRFMTSTVDAHHGGH